MVVNQVCQTLLEEMEWEGDWIADLVGSRRSLPHSWSLAGWMQGLFFRNIAVLPDLGRYIYSVPGKL